MFSHRDSVGRTRFFDGEAFSSGYRHSCNPPYLLCIAFCKGLFVSCIYESIWPVSTALLIGKCWRFAFAFHVCIESTPPNLRRLPLSTIHLSTSLFSLSESLFIYKYIHHLCNWNFYSVAQAFTLYISAKLLRVRTKIFIQLHSSSIHNSMLIL